jgi:hypothetical protein
VVGAVVLRVDALRAETVFFPGTSFLAGLRATRVRVDFAGASSRARLDATGAREAFPG